MRRGSLTCRCANTFLIFYFQSTFANSALFSKFSFQFNKYFYSELIKMSIGWLKLTYVHKSAAASVGAPGGTTMGVGIGANAPYQKK